MDEQRSVGDGAGGGYAEDDGDILCFWSGGESDGSTLVNEQTGASSCRVVGARWRSVADQMAADPTLGAHAAKS